MRVTIETSDPDAVNPEEIARTLEAAGYFVELVRVEGPTAETDRIWRSPEFISRMS